MMPPLRPDGARCGHGGERIHACEPARTDATRLPLFAALRRPPRRRRRLRRRLGRRAGLHLHRPERSRGRPRRRLPLRPARPGRVGARRPPLPHPHRRQPVRLLRPGAVVSRPRAAPPAGWASARKTWASPPAACRRSRQCAELVEVLDRCDYPILIHCHRGIDRTGMASTVALLLHTDASLAEAREQLGLRYVHLPCGKYGNIDRFFDLYQEWLAGPGAFAGTLPPLGGSRLLPRRVPGRGRVAGPRSRLSTTAGPAVRLPRPLHQHSVKPWVMQPGANAGVHVGWVLFNEKDESVREGRSGLFDAVVPPGEAVEADPGPAAAAAGTLPRAGGHDRRAARLVLPGRARRNL